MARRPSGRSAARAVRARRQLGDALGWAALSAVGIAAAELVSLKGAAEVWRTLTGSEPPAKQGTGRRLARPDNAAGPVRIRYEVMGAMHRTVTARLIGLVAVSAVALTGCASSATTAARDAPASMARRRRRPPRRPPRCQCQHRPARPNTRRRTASGCRPNPSGVDGRAHWFRRPTVGGGHLRLPVRRQRCAERITRAHRQPGRDPGHDEFSPGQDRLDAGALPAVPAAGRRRRLPDRPGLPDRAAVGVGAALPLRGRLAMANSPPARTSGATADAWYQASNATATPSPSQS